jgi:hypothetical protein
VNHMGTRTVPDVRTIEAKLDEVEEYAREVAACRRNLQRHGLASPAYHDLLPELSVQLDVLRLKATHASEALEEYLDLLPEDS